MKTIDVAIVDDEQNVLNSLKRLFRKENYELFFTTNCEKVMHLLSEGEIKVVMSDQKMIGITGIEFLKNIKKQYPRVVNILFTGYADMNMAEDAINEGEVYRFVNKPWNDDDLKSIVRQAVDKYDLEEKNRCLAENINKQNKKLTFLNKKLKNMYDAQKVFTSTLAHELRTPLASIRMALDIVMKQAFGEINNKQEDLLNKAKTNVNRLNRLINDILDLSKMEFEGAQLNFEKYELNSIIQGVIDNQRPLAVEHGLFLRTRLDQKISKVRLDSDRITQVLDNLINNAIKFTVQGGITVISELDALKKQVIICVEDTGMGIPEKDIPKLFKKFQQLAQPQTQSAKGTGLGLVICKEIIHQHGGEIWIKAGIEHGSSFCFSLPIK
ncbi:MAG: hybrid sensor histidine kinase/response regulator [Candidatus Omnitrophica bacterium]|nr:hybrid sensor histidine kinase/response regulator [Candidatus Omnitrophota bacterium]MBU1894895.1 hybrid sensor histidine kinase/response regulator [Candidatus Omnitrophota bacterium]